MPFVRPRGNRHIDVPLLAVKGIDRVQHITALGVTLSHNFSITKPVSYTHLTLPTNREV